jgi:hypothetical protein
MRTRFLTVIFVALLGAAVVPTPASGSTPALGSALERIEVAERLLDSGQLAEAVKAAAALGEVRLGAPSAPMAALPSGVPTSLAVPVSRLLGAIRMAEALVHRAIPSDPRLTMTLQKEMEIGELMVKATGSPPDRDALRELQRRQHEVEALVDEPALFTAGLVLAQALDRSLPELRLAASAMPSTESATTDAACDMVDQAPALCIAGNGANTLTADGALVIDLGGDDVHTHTAGGASTALPVAITVDLAGNDRYQRTSGPAQGAGNLGVGMLVDAAGNDVYSVAASGNVAGSTFGQGTNFSTGDGLLADLGGNDSYSLTNTKLDQASASGQGRGTQPGFGILLDQGVGDESYVVSAHPAGLIETPTEIKAGGLNAGGLGMGALGGVGIVADGGGTDAMTVETISPMIPAEDGRAIPSAPLTGPSGFGEAATGGAALMLTGPGNTTRTSAVSMGGPWTGIATNNAFGAGLLGVGALVDRGGDDTYTATALVHAARRIRIDDACACDGAHAEAHMSVPNVGAASMHAMGSSFTGVGLLRDESGNDVYRATVESIAEAEVRDERTTAGPEGPGASDAIATASASSLVAQGAGSGTSILEDLGGDDVYETQNVSRATAIAEARMPEVTTEAHAKSDLVYTNAQAAAEASAAVPGQAILRDLGGADRYTSFSESAASATPATEAATKAVSSSAMGSVSGNSQALLQDDDAGEQDIFTLTPADPACTGTRGQGRWQDCGAGAGLGIVDNEP